MLWINKENLVKKIEDIVNSETESHKDEKLAEASRLHGDAVKLLGTEPEITNEYMNTLNVELPGAIFGLLEVVRGLVDHKVDTDQLKKAYFSGDVFGLITEEFDSIISNRKIGSGAALKLRTVLSNSWDELKSKNFKDQAILREQINGFIGDMYDIITPELSGDEKQANDDYNTIVQSGLEDDLRVLCAAIVRFDELSSGQRGPNWVYFSSLRFESRNPLAVIQKTLPDVEGTTLAKRINRVANEYIATNPDVDYSDIRISAKSEAAPENPPSGDILGASPPYDLPALTDAHYTVLATLARDGPGNSASISQAISGSRKGKSGKMRSSTVSHILTDLTQTGCIVADQQGRKEVDQITAQGAIALANYNKVEGADSFISDLMSWKAIQIGEQDYGRNVTGVNIPKKTAIEKLMDLGIVHRTTDEHGGIQTLELSQRIRVPNQQ